MNKNKYSFTIIIALTLFFISSCSEKKTDSSEVASTMENVEAPNVDLHTAVISNNIDVIKQHIKAGSDLNVKDPMGGSSPLISAALFGKTEMAKRLIDAGADLNIQNNDGSTALITAAFFCRTDIVKLLLEKGADKTIQNNFKSTAYMSVVGDFASVKPAYDMMGKMLGPKGLKVDLEYLEKTRPTIAELLK